MLFIRYLAKRKPSLLDPKNKSRVLCSDDPLGRVFGVDCFTKEETRYVCALAWDTFVAVALWRTGPAAARGSQSQSHAQSGSRFGLVHVVSSSPLMKCLSC